MSDFSMLFTPIKIGDVEIRNRIAMAPMTSGYSSEDGYVTQTLIDFYLERANAGAGLITVESCYVDKRGKGFLGQLALDDDRYIPELRRLTDSMKATGAKGILQLIHCGRQTSTSLCGQQPVAPSPIPCPVIQEMPRELSADEVENIIQAFVDAAHRAKQAGFDGVEIHAAHGYLLNQFLSSYSNRRSDTYGGSLFNSSRMLLEIVAKIKEQVGREYPVLCRLSADEFVTGGLTLSDTKLIAGWLQNSGLDAISVSAGVYETAYRIIPPMDVEEGSLVHLAHGIKESVSIPVFAVGGINTPSYADRILIEGKADMVLLGRALLADHEWAAKAQKGELERIRPCIYCNHCRNRALRPKINCAVNYDTGREAELRPKRKTPLPKNVLVIGGGISGMEAAYIAALRGHRVSIYERAGEFGGNLLLASIPPKRERMRRIGDFLRSEIERLGVKTFLNTDATLGSIKQQEPEVVIIATGSEAISPELPGVERSNVYWAREVLQGHTDVGKYVVVVGGGLVGLETADYLREKGCAVIVVEELPEVGKDTQVEANFQKYLLGRLTKTNEPILIMTSTQVKEIGPDYVKVMQGSSEKTLPGIDSVIIAAGSRPFIPIAPEQLRSQCEVHVIGDAMRPQTLFEAVHSAAEVAHSI
jgi:2,4-dienoyl-CoA reductase-like NADH-dependent reductase (Old Yellow Enzyme family)/NADPH-dependent 2,4-dienoyl-CoA reductase/sulfur reductase-like enzyme